jgi:hypothetical protein
MTIILHPPEDTSFSGDAISGEDQARIARVLRAAVMRAVENAAREHAAGPRPDHPAGHPGDHDHQPQETFDPTRADLDLGIYQLPSYQDGGELTGVQLLELIPAAAPGYDVKDEPSPLEGGLIMILPGQHYVNLRSPRYVTAGSLSQAYLLGLAVFGTTSFAILQGPLGTRTSRYWAVGTDPAVSNSDLGEAVPSQAEPAGMLEAELAGKAGFVTGEDLEVKVIGSDGDYLTRGLVTQDRVVHWKASPMAAVWFAQLQAEQRKGTAAPPTKEFRRLVFSEVDRLVEQIERGDDSELQHAAALLSRMDRVAFSLVGWETKVGYLNVLLAAWTWQEEERAVVQIFKSLRSDSEVDAVIAMLKRAGRYDQLFDDLDNELYELLTTVGERFPKDHGPLTSAGLIQLLQNLGLVPSTVEGTLLGSVFEGPQGTTVPETMLDEAHDAVMGFVRFGADLGESIATIFTEPEKVVAGLGGLAHMLVTVELASLGYGPAMEEVRHALVGLGEKILAGMRGADRLGCGEKVVRRIKWRLVWEIASFFVGVGEIKTAIQGADIAGKLPGVLRFLVVLARLGEAAEVEVEGARLARLAAILKAERVAFSSAEEVAELLSRLPDQDLTRLGRLIARIDIKEGETLAELAARSPAIHAAIDDAAGKAELLKIMADQGGGLSEEIVEAFHVLIGNDGLQLADARRVVQAIPDGEGARFAAGLRRIPVARLAGESRAAFLELVATSPRRMDAVADMGADTFASVYRRAAGHGDLLDEYLAAIGETETRLPAQDRAAGFRQLLDRLEQDDPAAWLEVENTRRAQAGERVIRDWAQELSGSPTARRGLDRLLSRNQKAMVDSLIDQLAGDKGLISDLEVVQALEEVVTLGDRELDGMLELKRYVDRGGAYGDFPEWDEILFTEPSRRRNLLELMADLRDPARPADLIVTSGLEDVVRATLGHGANIQGGLGHLETARALLRDFPGARFRFEVTQLAGGVRRDVDIVVEMQIAGRQVDVEVKSYQVTTGLDHARRQISKDLVRHLGDPGGPWSDLLWRFPDPGYAGNFPAVERIFVEELGKLAAEGRLPMPLPLAQAALRARFTTAAPWTLIDVLH